MTDPIEANKIHPNKLAAMRAQAYPRTLDDNGRHWEDNLINKLQAENENLLSTQARLVSAVQNAKWLLEDDCWGAAERELDKALASMPANAIKRRCMSEINTTTKVIIDGASGHRMIEGQTIRYIERDGEKILQQLIKFTEYKNHKPVMGGNIWKDVPTEKEANHG